MPIKPAKAITFSRSSSHAGIGAPLSEVNPKGRDLFQQTPTRGHAGTHGHRMSAAEAHNEKPRRHPKIPTGSFMLSPLARLLHLNPELPRRGFVPARPKFLAVPLFAEGGSAETIAKPSRCLLNSS